jgi:hypothetical protein
MFLFEASKSLKKLYNLQPTTGPMFSVHVNREKGTDLTDLSSIDDDIKRLVCAIYILPCWQFEKCKPQH